MTGRPKRRPTGHALVAMVALLAVLGAGSSTSEEPDPASAPFEFALVGDYPYFPRDDVGFPPLLEDLRRAPDLDWILHLGDLHNPRATDCSEELFRARRDAFLDLGKPFVFTPGDNDWSDCEGDTTEWLATVRRVFFEDPTKMLEGAGVEIQRQPLEGAPSENLLWIRGGVVFATLHMIGGPKPPFAWIDDLAEDRAALREAGRLWMEEAFRVARERDARGVFLATQVSLWPHTANLRLLHVIEPHHLEPGHGFDGFLASLIDETRAFGKPVVVANGDTHVFRVDKPLVDEHVEMLQNFTRVEGFGSPNGHWVRVRVEPDREEVFSFRQEWVTENLYTLVPREARTDGFEDDGIGAAIYVVRVMLWVPTILAWIGAVAVARFVGRKGVELVRGWRDAD